MIIRKGWTIIPIVAALSLTACDDADVTGPGYICDVTSPVRDILVSPRDAQVLVHSPALETDTVIIAAVATGRFGSVRNDVPIEYESSDPSIATVDTLGVVRALSAGTVRITASACGESASATVTVLPSVVSVTVIPGSDTVVAGDSAVYTARAFGPGGVAVRNLKFTFSSPTAGVVFRQTSDSTSVVTSPQQPGTFAVNATTEGVTGTGSLLALPRTFLSGTALASAIDLGDNTSCGLISLGQGYCWGLNSYGQLGAATDSVCFDGIDPGSVTSDSVTTSALPCRLVPLRVGPALQFASISAGDSTTCGLVVAGRAYCWGNGTYGTIGNGSTAGSQTPAVVSFVQSFTTLSVGGQHACGIAAGGIAHCWGADAFGQLGDARRINSTTPIPVVRLDGNAPFASISAGWRHTCALTTSGEAFCWGNNERGQLGIGTSGGSVDVPQKVATSLSFASLSAGGDHTCGLTNTGAAYCWGSNLNGQLGTGSSGDQFSTPVAVAGGLTFTRISASNGTASVVPASGLRYKKSGAGHTCAVTQGGAIYCWGDNTDLQLGRGPFSTGPLAASGVPTEVVRNHIVGTVNFVSVSTGSTHSCGVATDGAAYCWGSNVFGALGSTYQAHFRGLAQRVDTPR